MFDTASPPAPDVDPFDEAVLAVQALRDIVHNQAKALSKEYMDRRTELQKSDGDSFIAVVLNVRARNEDRSIQLEWGNAHYKNGKRIGYTVIGGKGRGEADYSIQKLMSQTPAWAQELVKETEIKARDLREALLRLTDADTAIKVATRRIKKFQDQLESPGDDE